MALFGKFFALKCSKRPGSPPAKMGFLPFLIKFDSQAIAFLSDN